MFKLDIEGRVFDRPSSDTLTIAVPHHTEGYKAPVLVSGRYEGREALWDELEEGETIWVSGNGYQRREDGFVDLCVDIERFGRPGSGLTPGVNAGIQASCHGRIFDRVTRELAGGGRRAGEDVSKFTLTVNVPEMRAGQCVIVSCKVWGAEAKFIADQHRKGDRINVEGPLLELRFQAADGTPQRTHQLMVKRWTYGKDRPG